MDFYITLAGFAHKPVYIGVQAHAIYRHTHTTVLYGPLSESTRVSQYQKKHPSTHTPPAHQPSLSSSSIYHEPQHHPCSIHVLGNLSSQPLTMSSSAYLWVWSPLLHTPYTFSPSHYHPFATHVRHGPPTDDTSRPSKLFMYTVCRAFFVSPGGIKFHTQNCSKGLE